MGEKLNTESFIERAKEIHGYTYIYDKTVYKFTTQKVIITCKVHGDFEQEPRVHLKGRGCRFCGYIKTGKSLVMNTQIFKDRAKLVHGDRYDYSGVEYITARQKVKIICKDHGVFYQTPDGHLSGRNCRRCAMDRIIDSQRMTLQDFISRSIEIFGDKYDYSLVEYKNRYSKISIVCPEHGIFQKRPCEHLLGQGCPACTNYGFNVSKPAILYYVRINFRYRDPLYKIGITNLSIKERFRKRDMENITIVDIEQFEIGQDAYNKEQDILKLYSDFKYAGEPVLESGNTEVFINDILGLDKLL